ncbi:MAG: peptidylprolyl isomerase [Thermoanaerobaculia bacterium]|nr:peptidylprolyl isomerase [Thermoanaerobaculia bacterium]
MRKLLPILLFTAVSCSLNSRPPAPNRPPEAHGLTLEEEAQILAMEDRREVEPAIVTGWVAQPNVLHRARIALALGRIGGKGATGPLTTLAADDEAQVRTIVALALGEIGEPEGVEPLFRLATDPNATVASEAAEALAKMAAQLELGRYAALTTRGPDGVRARAIRFLFRFNTDEAGRIAADMLESPSPLLRQEAAYALSRRGYAPARARLELLAGDSDVMTRAHVVAALGRIGAAESMPLLIRALGDVHPWVRTNAAVAASRGAAAASNVALPSDDIPRVIALTEDPDPGTRSAAVDLLGYYAVKHEPARKRLLEISANGTRWERELAAGAIVKHFGETNLALLPADLTSWGKVRALEASSQMKTAGPLLRRRFASDPDAMVRANVVGSIPDETVDAEIDLLRPALDDPDPIIRANAIDRYAQSKSEPSDARMRTLQAAEERARSDRENDARLAAIRGLAGIEYEGREAFLRSLVSGNDPVARRIAAGLIEEKLKVERPPFTPLGVSRTAAEYAEIAAWSRQPHTATIHMTRGVIELALLTQDAPMTAWNFAQLAKSKYFDNTSFMRVVPNFVIQGGDPRNDQNGGPGYAIRDEINLQKYTRGAVGMALSGPDTGGSQFFITHSPQPHLDGGYTVFARVYSGMTSVVDQTERGDRVETITIDEKPPVSRAEIEAVQRPSLPLVIGRTNAERVLSILPEYAAAKAAYQPDETVVEMIAAAMQPGDRMEIIMGTWCSDSLREVPRFLKIADVMREKYGKELPLSVIAVDRSKTQPADLIANKSIEKVATFIYYRGEQELGRIVERPVAVFEDDLLAIAARPRS